MRRTEMRVKIQVGVPLPSDHLMRYEFHRFKVGDSAFYNVPRPRAATAARRYGRNHKMKFVTRKEKKDCRVWRIK